MILNEELFDEYVESAEGDKIAQDAIDSKNANFEKDKEADRQVKIELAKQGIVTEDLDSDFIQNNKDLLEYLYSEIVSSDRHGNATVDPDYIDYEAVIDTYSEDVTRDQYDKCIKILQDQADNVKYYTSDGSRRLIELSDNHTMFEIDSDVELDPGEYWDIASMYCKQFEDETGIELFTEGRSSRHICVEDNFDNFINYDALKSRQRELEKDFIDYVNTHFTKTEESLDEDITKFKKRWIEGDNYEYVAVKVNGKIIKKGDKVGDDYVTGFDPSTDTIFLNENPNIDGGRDYSVEDVLSFIDRNNHIDESLNEGTTSQDIINNNFDGVNDKIKALEIGQEMTIKVSSSFGYNTLHIKRTSEEYYTLWNTNQRGDVANLSEYSSLDNAMYWANAGFVSLDADQPIEEKLFDLADNDEDRLIQLQGLVDNAVELFGRVPGSFYDDFDEIGFYITEIDGKYIVKKKVTNESYKVVDKDGKKVAQGGGFTSKKEAEQFALQYGEKDLRVVRESLNESSNLRSYTFEYKTKDDKEEIFTCDAEDGEDARNQLQDWAVEHNQDPIRVLKTELNEELGDIVQTEQEVTLVNENNGLATVVNNLIQDEWQAIQGYNDAIVNFEAEGRSDLVTVLRDLVAEENIHVGQLETLLTQIDSSADKIAEGEVEAESQINPEQIEITEDISTEDENYTLEYINRNGDIMARDYFNSIEEAKAEINYLIDIYKDDETNVRALTIVDRNSGDDIFSVESDDGKDWKITIGE